jgi:hypothetical protein
MSSAPTHKRLRVFLEWFGRSIVMRLRQRLFGPEDNERSRLQRTCWSLDPCDQTPQRPHIECKMDQARGLKSHLVKVFACNYEPFVEFSEPKVFGCRILATHTFG